MLLETLMSDPDSVQKVFPSRVKDFWCFSGPWVGGLGRASPQSSSRSGTPVAHLSAHSCGAGEAEF